MPNTFPVEVPHLFGTTAACQMPKPYDASKPTCVLVNSFTMTSDLYKAQFDDQNLTDAMNLIAIEPLGHGQTRTNSPSYTYWDTAIMNLQVLDVLGVKGSVFAVGTSQGGWIVARMALLAPQRITGILPLGSSMDYESERARALGCFDAPSILTPVIQDLQSTTLTPDFVMPKNVSELSIYTGLGKDISQEQFQMWQQILEANYSDNDGRLRLKECAINLRDRDGLHGRLFEVICPVLWLHGSQDMAYSVANAREEIKLFVNSVDARLEVVEGGHHYLSATHPKAVNDALRSFVTKYA